MRAVPEAYALIIHLFKTVERTAWEALAMNDDAHAEWA